jgi:hypothetical protein
MNWMNCWTIRSKLPGYLDGALPSREHKPISEHLQFCSDCRRELERYRKLSSLMSRLERVPPPPDLALHIRLAASSLREQKPFGQRLRERAALLVADMLETIAVPATGGVMATMLVFVVVLQSLFVGVPVGAVPNDVPTNLMQPARLESLPPFSVSDSDQALAGASVVWVEAIVNADGQAVAYQILAGPNSLAVRKQLDQVMLFTRFRPQMSFGRPVPGGRVVLSFSEVRVKG